MSAPKSAPPVEINAVNNSQLSVAMDVLFHRCRSLRITSGPDGGRAWVATTPDRMDRQVQARVKQGPINCANTATLHASAPPHIRTRQALVAVRTFARGRVVNWL